MEARQRKDLRRMGTALVAAMVVALSAQKAVAWPWSSACCVDGASAGLVGPWPGIYACASHVDMWDDWGNCWSTNVPWYYLRGSFSLPGVPVNRWYHFRVSYGVGAGPRYFDRWVGRPWGSSWDVGNLW